MKEEIEPIKRVIVLGNGKRIGLGAYVNGWKACKAAPEGTRYKHGLTGWGPETREEILKGFDYGLHDRINRHIPGYGTGRKWDADWYWTMVRTAREVNTPRLLVYWVPAELRGRLAHRIANREDN